MYLGTGTIIGKTTCNFHNKPGTYTLYDIKQDDTGEIHQLSQYRVKQFRASVLDAYEPVTIGGTCDLRETFADGYNLIANMRSSQPQEVMSA